MSQTAPIVSFNHANISHGGFAVLKNVTFNVFPGEFVYLIGKVGSGKTSLIKTMDGELPLKTGEGTVAGYSLNRLKKKHIPYLRRKMGVVFQDFQLLTDRNVYDNLMFVLQATGWKRKSHPDRRIREVLHQVGLETKDDQMPWQLSGGEQQRVVIARALLNHPELILADEPTGNLDPETSSEIMELLVDIKNSGQTVIMVTHNYSLLKKYPFRTIKCENESVSEMETLQEIDFNLLMEEDNRAINHHLREMDALFSAYYPGTER
ncbi:MAG: ATP-binding cassette domain-containing protein [Bacteroidales bacterium]|jgi:cell division transport system ATP-binding protein|nr:ATP-binding cassette domain-containing protein [Bacteroidales bacterium]